LQNGFQSEAIIGVLGNWDEQLPGLMKINALILSKNIVILLLRSWTEQL